MKPLLVATFFYRQVFCYFKKVLQFWFDILTRNGNCVWKQEGSFAQLKVWQSASIAVVFFINPYISLQTMLIIMLAAIGLSLAGVLFLTIKVEKAIFSSRSWYLASRTVMDVASRIHLTYIVAMLCIRCRWNHPIVRFTFCKMFIHVH